MVHKDFWEAERILDEKKENGESLVLIKWLGVDSNGNPWQPTWEPEKNCTEALIREWNLTKGERKVNNKTRSFGRRLSVSSCNILSESGVVGDSGDVAEDHYSSETSTIMGDDEEDESQNGAEEIPKENSNITASSIFSAVAGLIGIPTSQKRPQSESRIEHVNDAKKICTREPVDSGDSKDVPESVGAHVFQQSPHTETPTEVHSFSRSNDRVISDKQCVNTTRLSRNNGDGVNSNENQDVQSFINEIKGKNNYIACLVQEKEHLQRKLKQYEKNRKYHQSKNQALAQENIQAHKLFQEKQKELTRAYAQLSHILEEFERIKVLCNKKDAKMKAMEIELEEHRRQFDGKRKKDQRQIALLKKTNSNLTMENEKLLRKTESPKVSNSPISDHAQLGQKTRSSGNIQVLRAENEKLTSKISSLNLQNTVQQQELTVLKEKMMEQESIIQLLMGIQKINYQGDLKAEDLKKSFVKSINSHLQNTSAPPVYARSPVPLPQIEFIPWNGMPLKN
ncbi:16070_t:CDS:2 [Acaulospora morrowiae]|uniref:16070_t:CDS:1 n=1 Tax=Acaulospora morrowiae TaxID=94023 RepID=A0A9N8ZX91_9GLOM|nr:16070_t:CDS:2 [Acaulospora morrowiae]